jgi:class 3 adenylate cyclase/predicted ATPase
MSEIRKWLMTVGLAQYADAFEANDLDVDLLPQIDDQTLKEVGVVSVGHRLRIRNAIAKMGAASRPDLDVGSTPVPAGMPASSAERRHVTVMFCDLCGSTALSARMDPEDLREVIAAYQKCVAETVRRLGGFVAKYMGDGVVVYFGYPQAHEHDAERAVRAGLELITAVAGLKSRVPVQVRVGIAAGLVVVGDLIGSGEAQEHGIFGETPNLAARLQDVAAPGTVVIAESTRKLLGDLFELRDLGLHELKGLAAPARAFAVVRAGGSDSRFEALRAGELSALVGREAEADLLRQCWQRAKRGDGQVVLLCGEPGIGKSRLAAAVRDWIATEPHSRLRYFCSPHHPNSALYPVVQQLERAAAFAPGDDAEARLDKLDLLLAQTSTPPDDRAIIADLLSVAGAGRYPQLDFSPQERRIRTIDAILRQVEARAHALPLLAVFEDVHWIDPTSLDLLGRLVDRIRSLKILLIVSFRPEFVPRWAGQSHVTVLTLDRLVPQECRRLVDQVAGEASVPNDLVDEIVARSDGVPLFVEELTKAVVEAGTTRAARAHIADIPSAALSVPATLHASLMARLDRLGRAKEVAQIGAAIGREFSYQLISAVAGRSDTELADALDRLTDAGLVIREGRPPDATFLFKHALLQDAAYGTLLREARRDLHARIAGALKEGFPQTRDAQPEILARHYFEAGQSPAAGQWWARAGELALHRSAFAEAAAHFGKAGEMADRAPPDAGPAASASDRLKLQTSLGQALIWAKGYGAPETAAAYARARELAKRVEDADERFSAYYGLWVGSLVRGESQPMEDMAQAFMRDAAPRPGSVEAGVAHRILGVTCWYRGDYVDAREHLDEALRTYDPKRDRDRAFRFGQDYGAAVMIYLAIVLWPLGETKRARRVAEEAMAHAIDTGHVPTIAYVHTHKCLFESFRGDARRAMSHAEATLSLSREHGLSFFLPHGDFCMGWAQWRLGDQAGLDRMRTSLRQHGDQGVATMVPISALLLAAAEAEEGEIEAAVARLDAAFAETERTGQRAFNAELHRLRGVLLFHGRLSDGAAARAALKRALDTARAQRTRAFELRAALSLAELYQATGSYQAARDLLGPVVAGFTDVPDLPEFEQAHRLLAGLSKPALSRGAG